MNQVDKDAENPIIHTFNNYGWEFIVELMKYLGLDCEEC
jgi:hypothetical protein